MGPGLEKTPHRGIMEPPKISNSGEHAHWKRDVANSVDFIVAGSEKGEDKLFKSLRATLGGQLYNVGLNHSQQRQVDYAQLQGTIYYKQDDQVKAVQQIFDLVAVEPPMVVVTRLIDSFNRCLELY